MNDPDIAPPAGTGEKGRGTRSGPLVPVPPESSVVSLASRRRDQYEELLGKLASLETFQRQIRECEQPEKVFGIASDHLCRIVPFQQLGFWLVEPEQHEFVLGHCYPPVGTEHLQDVVREEIASGTFAWALQQTRSILVRNQRTGQDLLLSGLATRARTVGMFVGVLEPEHVRLAENSRELLSLIFLGLTYTLENFQLLGELKHYNEHLQDLVQLRTSEVIKKNADLKRESADRRRAETALQRSENRYRAVVLALDDGVVILNLAGRVVGSNPAAARILGVTEDALREVTRFETRWSWIGEDGAALAAADIAFQATLRTGMAVIGRVLGFTDDQGGTRWLQVNTQPLKEEGEEFHNGAVLSFTDITEKRRVEADLQKSEERLRYALDAAEDGMWDWNVETGNLIWNRRYLTMLGYGADELPASTATWEKLVHPDDWPQVRQRLDHHLSGELPVYEAEYRMQTRVGGWKWVLDRGRVVRRDERGRPLRMVGLHQDTTERRQAEEELRTAKAAAESADRAKGDFLAMMSHELRTPMNGIIGFTNLLSGSTLTREQRDYVQLVALSSKQLLSLLNDLLDFSKIEAGQLVLEKHAFSIRQLLDEVIDLASSQAREKRIDLSLQVQETLPDHIVGDSIRLRQILLNLLGNALKFTERGEVFLRLRQWEGERPPGAPEGSRWFWWSVRDSGIGIPAEKQGSLFQPFIQADSSTTRKYGGTGLGLAICKRLCEAMAGRIWFESQENVGSTFHFLTPMEERTAATSVPAPGGEPFASPQEIDGLFGEGDGALPVRRRAALFASPERGDALRRRLARFGFDCLGEPGTGAGPLSGIGGLHARAPFDIAVVERGVLGDGWTGELAALLGEGERLGFSLLFLAGSEVEAASARSLLLQAPGQGGRPFRAVVEREIGALRDALRELASGMPPAAETPAGEGGRDGAGAHDASRHLSAVSLRILFFDRDPLGLKLAQHLLTRLGHRLTWAKDSDALLAEVERGEYDAVLVAFQGSRLPWVKPLQAACERLEKAGRVPRLIGIADTQREHETFAPRVPLFREWISKPLRLEKLSALLSPAPVS